MATFKHSVNIPLPQPITPTLKNKLEDLYASVFLSQYDSEKNNALIALWSELTSYNYQQSQPAATILTKELFGAICGILLGDRRGHSENLLSLLHFVVNRRDIVFSALHLLPTETLTQVTLDIPTDDVGPTQASTTFRGVGPDVKIETAQKGGLSIFKRSIESSFDISFRLFSQLDLTTLTDEQRNALCQYVINNLNYRSDLGDLLNPQTNLGALLGLLVNPTHRFTLSDFGLNESVYLLPNFQKSLVDGISSSEAPLSLVDTLLGKIARTNTASLAEIDEDNFALDNFVLQQVGDITVDIITKTLQRSQPVAEKLTSITKTVAFFKPYIESFINQIDLSTLSQANSSTYLFNHLRQVCTLLSNPLVCNLLTFSPETIDKLIGTIEQLKALESYPTPDNWGALTESLTASLDFYISLNADAKTNSSQPNKFDALLTNPVDYAKIKKEIDAHRQDIREHIFSKYLSETAASENRDTKKIAKLAYLVVSDPELWKQVNPYQRFSFKAFLYRVFGAYKAIFDINDRNSEVSKLRNLHTSFAAKFDLDNSSNTPSSPRPSSPGRASTLPAKPIIAPELPSIPPASQPSTPRSSSSSALPSAVDHASAQPPAVEQQNSASSSSSSGSTSENDTGSTNSRTEKQKNGGTLAAAAAVPSSASASGSATPRSVEGHVSEADEDSVHALSEEQEKSDSSQPPSSAPREAAAAAALPQKPASPPPITQAIVPASPSVSPLTGSAAALLPHSPTPSSLAIASSSAASPIAQPAPAQSVLSSDSLQPVAIPPAAPLSTAISAASLTGNVAISPSADSNILLVAGPSQPPHTENDSDHEAHASQSEHDDLPADSVQPQPLPGDAEAAATSDPAAVVPLVLATFPSPRPAVVQAPPPMDSSPLSQLPNSERNPSVDDPQGTAAPQEPQEEMVAVQHLPSTAHPIIVPTVPSEEAVAAHLPSPLAAAAPVPPAVNPKSADVSFALPQHPRSPTLLPPLIPPTAATVLPTDARQATLANSVHIPADATPAPEMFNASSLPSGEEDNDDDADQGATAVANTQLIEPGRAAVSHFAEHAEEDDQRKLDSLLQDIQDANATSGRPPLRASTQAAATSLEIKVNSEGDDSQLNALLQDLQAEVDEEQLSQHLSAIAQPDSSSIATLPDSNLTPASASALPSAAQPADQTSGDTAETSPFVLFSAIPRRRAERQQAEEASTFTPTSPSRPEASSLHRMAVSQAANPSYDEVDASAFPVPTLSPVLPQTPPHSKPLAKQSPRPTATTTQTTPKSGSFVMPTPPGSGAKPSLVLPTPPGSGSRRGPAQSSAETFQLPTPPQSQPATPSSQLSAELPLQFPTPPTSGLNLNPAQVVEVNDESSAIAAPSSVALPTPPPSAAAGATQSGVGSRITIFPPALGESATSSIRLELIDTPPQSLGLPTPPTSSAISAPRSPSGLAFAKMSPKPAASRTSGSAATSEVASGSSDAYQAPTPP